MKRIVVLVLPGLLTILLFSACREDKNSANHSNNLEDRLIIELFLKASKDDSFEVYYRNDNDMYTSSNRVEAKVEGSAEFQKVIFVLDQFVYPTHIRLIFGKNQNQGEILIKHFILKYNDAEHIFTKEEIKKYFRPSKSFDFNFEAMIGKAKKEENKFYPYLDSNNISKFVNRLKLY